jgi:lipid-binding SYLF domain-containing protein
MKKSDKKDWRIVTKKSLLGTVIFLTAVIVALSMIGPVQAGAATAAEIDGNVDAALKTLYATSPAAKELSKVAKGILVFPEIVKGGVIIGGQYGVGALRKEGKTEGYYNTAAASYGLQLGLQKFGYAMFLMTDSAMEYLNKSSGWEIGVGPSIVIVDAGIAGSLTTTTAKEDIYAFFFSQKGLMAGLGLQGSKITRITPDKE